MRKPTTNFAHLLLLLIWLLCSLPNGLVVLCMGHSTHPQVEFAIKDACQPASTEHGICDSFINDICLAHQNCTDIPYSLQLAPVVNLQREHQATILTIAPVILSHIDTALANVSATVSLPPPWSTHAPPSDPATTSGSITLLI